MNKFIFFLLILVTSFSQSLSISPEFTYQYESDNEQYAMEDLTMQDFALIIIGEYSKNRLNILARMGYHLLDGVRSKSSDFTRVQGLHWVELPPGIADDQSSYYVSDLKLQYGDSTNYFYFNKWDQHWGPGVNSLTISNKIPRFFHFGFQWQIIENIQFEYFHGKLKSGMHDENYTSHYSTVGSRSFDILRNIAGHRLEWQPFEKWIVSGSELITYANRSIELTYLLPFVPFFPIQTYVGETDNVIMSGDIQFIPNEDLRLFGVFLMDEWSPPFTFDKDNRNWFGWQAGFQWRHIGLLNSKLHLEYTWTDHRIYRHRFPVNDFYSWGYPVGFWAGPHAQELYVDYSFSIVDNHLKIIYSNAKRGVLTDSLLDDQYARPNDDPIYERFSGETEEKQVILLSLNRDITEKLNLNLNYTFVDWKNAGFNPNIPLLEEYLPDMTKHSMGIAVQYRY